MVIPGFTAELSLVLRTGRRFRTQTPMLASQPLRAQELVVAALKKDMPDIPDDPSPTNKPPVVTAGTSAVCSKGIWHASTGSKSGECRNIKDSKGNTTHVHCHDNDHNGALVTCSTNGGVGSCSTIGAGECEFKKTK